MRTKIYYAGDKPSIQEVATVIAQEFKLPAEQLQPAYMPEGLAIGFIGTEDHNGKPHKVAVEFANTLDTKRMEACALFCCSPQEERRVPEGAAQDPGRPRHQGPARRADLPWQGRPVWRQEPR
jgi:hypothetical protein